jgi:uncharacterized phage protein (TIGR02218 family)
MKARSPGLAAAQAAEVTTLAWCLRIEAVGGDVFARTSVDIPLTVSGEVYDPVDGIAPTAIQGSADLSVQNMEVSGFLTALGINEADILAGKWDGAHCSLFEVNYSNLSQGVMRLQSGTLGQISVSRLSYQSELRGLAQALQQTNGKVVTKNCTAQFGDAKCKKDLAPLTVAGSVTSVTSRRLFADTARAEPSDYFGAGLFRVTNGPMAGEEMEIDRFTGGVFSLVLPLSQNPEVGMTYEAIPGCRKRFAEDCVIKWANPLNYRGFPNIPGADTVLGLGGTEGTNL